MKKLLDVRVVKKEKLIIKTKISVKTYAKVIHSIIFNYKNVIV